MILALSRGVSLHPITIWAMKGSRCPSFTGCWCHRRAQSGVVSRHVVFKSCRPKKKCGQSLSLWTHRWSMMTMFRMSPKHGYFSLKELWSYLLIGYWMGWPSSCTSYIWRYYPALKHLKRGTNTNKLAVEVLCFELPFGTETQPFFIPIFCSATEPTNCFRLEHCHFLAEPPGCSCTSFTRSHLGAFSKRDIQLLNAIGEKVCWTLAS